MSGEIENTDPDITDKVVSGEAWAEYCDMLKAAGQVVLDRSGTGDVLDRTEGYRFLARLARGGLQSFVEGSTTRFPRVRTLPDQVKIGSDNPDGLYQTVNVDGRYDYRLWGTRGSVHYLGIGAYTGNYGGNQEDLGIIGYLDDHSLDVGEDGTIEIIMSTTPHNGNWLELGPAGGLVNIRQFFLDRESEEPGRWQVERIGADEEPPPLTPTAFYNSLIGAGFFVEGCARMFTDWAAGWADESPNELIIPPDDTGQAAWADPNQLIWHGYWSLQPDEALVIDAVLPDLFYWNFQLDNIWMESLDYRYHQVTVNAHSARYEDEDRRRIKIVVADEDPGVGNWIDTVAHRHGAMSLRLNQAKGDAVVDCNVVPLADL